VSCAKVSAETGIDTVDGVEVQDPAPDPWPKTPVARICPSARSVKNFVEEPSIPRAVTTKTAPDEQREMPIGDHEGLLPKLKGASSGLVNETTDGCAHRIATDDGAAALASIAPVEASPWGIADAP
jgi:hypothetical protein